MQRDVRATLSSALRLRLLAGAASVALASIGSPVWAQDGSEVVVTAPGPDGLTQDGAYIESDAVTREGDVITAIGETERVVARFREATLRAGRVSYDLRQGIAAAERDVEFTDPEGNVIFASLLELDSDLRAGVAVDFAT